MKKIKMTKIIVMLFAVFAMSSCEENGPIQFIVIDQFSSSVAVNGLQGQNSYEATGNVDITDLLSNASNIVAAGVESVTVKLNENYSGTELGGNVKIYVGTLEIISSDLNLTKDNPITIEIPTGVLNILPFIQGAAGSFPVRVVGLANSPLVDDNFNVDVTLRVNATLEK